MSGVGYAAHIKRVSDDVAGGKFMGTRKKFLVIVADGRIAAANGNGDSCGSGR